MGFITRLVSTFIGAFVLMLGLARISIAAGPPGHIAGLLMVIAGAVVVPRARDALGALLGTAMTGRDAATVAAMCIVGSAVINLILG